VSTSQNIALGSARPMPGGAWSYRRPLLAHFLFCAYCVGFWISLLVYLAWVFFPTEAVYGAAPFALSAAVGMLAKNLDR
jgi:hypothetical protein